jgi:hypothetical protein
MGDELEASFMLGLKVSEYLYNIQVDSDKVLTILEDIVNGNLTLVDTPADTISKFPAGMPESVKNRLPEMLHASRLRQRKLAKNILDSINKTI